MAESSSRKDTVTLSGGEASVTLLEKSQAQLPEYTRPKVNEFVHWFRSREWTMKAIFRWYGRFIGAWPAAGFITFVLISMCSIGIIRMELRDRLRDGYTPTNSRAYEESKALKAFSGLQGDPMMTIVILKARDNSSMTDVANLNKTVELFKYLKFDLSVMVDAKNASAGRMRYIDFCGHHCQQNDPVSYYLLEKDVYERRMSRNETFNGNLSYPVARYSGYPLHLERNFYGIKTSEDEDRRNNNIDFCEYIVLSFTADIKDPSVEAIVARWEVTVFEFAQKRAAEEQLQMFVIGAEIVDLEMNKDSQKMTPYFVVGFLGAVVFVMLSAWFSFFLYSPISFKDSSTLKLVAFMALPLGACIVSGAAITTTFGIYGILGLRINSLMLIMPFLIMGIGVNDSFLVIHHWLREKHASSRAQLMGRVFEDVGPSITMTTLTNVISFTVGALTPTEEIALFCAGSATAMGLAYLFTLLFFGALLAVFTDEEGREEPKQTVTQRKTKSFFSTILRFYAKLLQNKYFRALFVLVWVGFIIGGFVGWKEIDSKLETEKILPKETTIHKPNRIIEGKVWPEYYPVIVIVQSPFDIADAAKRQRVWSMVRDFENVRGWRENGTLFFLPEYEEYFNRVADAGDVFSSDEDDEAKITVGAYDNSQLSGFLRSPVYSHYNGMVVYDETQSPPIRRFTVLISYRNHTTWSDRIVVQQEWRDVVDKYPDLNATIWNVNGMFVDQMNSLDSVATQSIVATLGCMAIVCLCFIQKIVAVCVATISIGSIAVGTIGYLGIWELDLDPVTICAILISIGMSVDFTAHISMYYINCPRRDVREAPSDTERLKFAIASVFWPALQGNFSTLLCVVPLVAMQNYIPLVFVKTITLVVIIGTAHGLLLIPMFLSMLPSKYLDFDLLSHIPPITYTAAQIRQIEQEEATARRRKDEAQKDRELALLRPSTDVDTETLLTPVGEKGGAGLPYPI